MGVRFIVCVRVKNDHNVLRFCYYLIFFFFHNTFFSSVFASLVGHDIVLPSQGRRRRTATIVVVILGECENDAKLKRDVRINNETKIMKTATRIRIVGTHDSFLMPIAKRASTPYSQ